MLCNEVWMFPDSLSEKGVAHRADAGGDTIGPLPCRSLVWGWDSVALALQLTRTNTMRPDRLAASFDPGLDRVIDSNKGLDV